MIAQLGIKPKDNRVKMEISSKKLNNIDEMMIQTYCPHKLYLVDIIYHLVNI